MLKEHTEHLVNLGLSEKQAAVYLTMLTLGDATAEKLANEANLNRSTTYVQIKDLMKLGLASTFKHDKKTLFAAESPTNLERILEKKQKNLKEQVEQAEAIVPELMSVFTSTGVRPVIRTFEGREGLITMRNQILNSKVKEVYIATDFDSLYGLFSKKELMDYSRSRVKKGIKSYVLYNKLGEDAVVVEPQELKRLSKENFPFPSEVYIYGDTVSIASVSGQIVGVTITNSQIADSMLSIFKLAWHNS